MVFSLYLHQLLLRFQKKLILFLAVFGRIRPNFYEYGQKTLKNGRIHAKIGRIILKELIYEYTG